MSDGFDDEPTPDARRKRYVQSDDQRALGSASRHRKKSYPHGVPVAHDEESPTNPIALLELELDPSEIKYVERLRRHTDDPYVGLFKLAKTVKRIIRESESNNVGVNDQLATAISNQERVLEELQRKAKFATRIAGLAITAALAGIGGLVAKVWDRAGDEREAAVNFRYLREDFNRLRDRFESVAREWFSPPLPTPKDKQP